MDGRSNAASSAKSPLKIQAGPIRLTYSDHGNNGYGVGMYYTPIESKYCGDAENPIVIENTYLETRSGSISTMPYYEINSNGIKILLDYITPVLKKGTFAIRLGEFRSSYICPSTVKLNIDSQSAEGTLVMYGGYDVYILDIYPIQTSE